MNKKIRDLQAKIKEQKDLVKGYMTEGEGYDMDKAEAAMNEVDKLEKQLAVETRAAEMLKSQAPEVKEVKTGKVDAVKALADAARARFKGMTEGTPADGGYTVPEDISTKINTFKEERFSLASLIDRETVTTLSGRRTYKSRAQHTGFSVVGEGGKIGKTGKPQFEVLNYSVKKYAGYLPATNELLDDSDAAIANMIISWLGEEEIATENAQILAKVKEKEATAITGLKDIKKAVNVTLAAFAGSVRIVTNSDGLNYLDTLEDKNGRPLLSPDPVKPMDMSLCVGARRIPVTVVPNEVLTSADGKIPFIMGDLREYMKEFRRKELTLTVSDTAAVEGFNAFEQDMTLFRAIMRADYVVKDAAAIVYGELAQA